MPRARKPENKGLPTGWRIKNGGYRYMVPKGQEEFWDGKQEFSLGKNLGDAYRTFAGRMARYEGAVQTIGQLIDRYLVEVTPTKSSRTQLDELKYLIRLKEMVGDNSVADFKPHNAYRLRDVLKSKATKGSGEMQANRHMAALKHVFTKSIEWGLRDNHPMHEGSFKMFPEAKTQMKVPSLEEIQESIKPENCKNPMIRAYVKLKLQTGLRRTDLLGLTKSHVTPDCLTVTLSKTQKKTGKVLEFEMTPELRGVIVECNAILPLSPYLFKTRKGVSYLKEDKTANGFTSIWQRWQNKMPEDKQFAERSIRNYVGHQGDEQGASEILGDSIETTRKHYRSNVTKVKPLSSSS